MMTPPKAAPLRSRLRLAHPRGPLRLFPPRTDPADPAVATPAGALRGRLRIGGHPITVLWWRRQPPPDVADAVQLDADFWLALRVD